MGVELLSSSEVAEKADRPGNVHFYLCRTDPNEGQTLACSRALTHSHSVHFCIVSYAIIHVLARNLVPCLLSLGP